MRARKGRPGEAGRAGQGSPAESSGLGEAERPDGGNEAARGSRRADPVAWLIALAAFVAYGTLSVFRYLRLDPGSWDLGIFTEYVKQLAHLRPPVVAIRGAGFNLLGDHFQPIVALIAPFFRLFPSPVTLLIAQALLTALSVLPVCRAAQDLLGTGASRAIGLAYGFSWGLQQMINFDFHEIAFAVPLLAFSLSAILRRRPLAAVAWALPLVFVKEDQGFTVAAIGLFMTVIAMGRAGRRWAPAGLVLVLWGMTWAVLAITVIVPHFNPGHQYPYWVDGGVVGPGGHVSLGTLVHQLASAGQKKVWTVFMVLLPTAFLALRSPLVAVAAPGLLLRFLSTNSYFWGVNWHYNATVMPVVFLAAIDAIARLRARAAWAGPREGSAVPGGERPGEGSAVPGGERRGEGSAVPGGERLGEGSAVPGGERPAPARKPAAQTAVAGRRVRRLGALVARAAPAVMVIIAAVLAFRFPLAGLWDSQTYAISPHVRAERAAMARVPDGATVEATLSMLAPLAARDDTFWVGTSGTQAPRYIVFDEADSGFSPPPANVLAFVDQRHDGFSYRQVFEQSNVYVFRRGGRTGG